MKYMVAILVAIITATSVLCEESKTGRIEVVGPASIDFGRYSAIEKKIAKYKIRNSGKGTLKILNIRKNCGCASATSSKKEILPREEAEIEVVILPNSIFDLFNKNVFVESSDPENRFLQLAIAGNAIPLVRATPSASIHIGRIPTNTINISQSILLTPATPDIVLGIPVVSNNAHIIQALLATTGSNYRLNFGMEPTAKSGDINTQVLIPFSSPSNIPPVSITITGRIGVELFAIPGIIYLTASDHPVKATVKLRLVGNRKRVLNPTTVNVPKQKDITTAISQDADGRNLNVTLTFLPEFTKQLYADENIPIYFSVPDASSAQVICKIRK